MKEENQMFTIVFGGIGIIFDLLVIGAIVAIASKVVIKIVKAIKHVVIVIKS